MDNEDSDKDEGSQENQTPNDELTQDLDASKVNDLVSEEEDMAKKRLTIKDLEGQLGSVREEYSGINERLEKMEGVSEALESIRSDISGLRNNPVSNPSSNPAVGASPAAGANQAASPAANQAASTVASGPGLWGYVAMGVSYVGDGVNYVTSKLAIPLVVSAAAVLTHVYIESNTKGASLYEAPDGSESVPVSAPAEPSPAEEPETFTEHARGKVRGARVRYLIGSDGTTKTVIRKGLDRYEFIDEDGGVDDLEWKSEDMPSGIAEIEIEVVRHQRGSRTPIEYRLGEIEAGMYNTDVLNSIKAKSDKKNIEALIGVREALQREGLRKPQSLDRSLDRLKF